MVLLCIIAMLDLLEHPHNSRPYVQIAMIIVLKIKILFATNGFDFLPINQFNYLMVRSTYFRFLIMCCFHVILLSIVIPRYFNSVFGGIGILLIYSLGVSRFR
jgi:hypothetical protein